MLAEASTREISKKKKPDSFTESKIVAKEGGHVAKTARKELETQIGRSIISPLNAQDSLLIDGENRTAK
ncbi:MAG: hypothetical protein WC637_11360 [Victivallales bacterium]|jgi:hypothetical protein